MSKRKIILLPDKFKKKTGIHVVTAHRGKMEGMASISTSCLCNKHCKEYSKNDENICSYCYANTSLRTFAGMQDNCKKNTEILTSRILTPEELPVLNYSYFRFEAFGDLVNETQLINYFNICRNNKGTHFALWTKNPFIVQSAISKGYKKPRNLNIILSSMKVNKPAEHSKYDFVDKIFTVYSDDYISENKIEINCGSKSCLLCQKCYRKTKEKEINERLKVRKVKGENIA